MTLFRKRSPSPHDARRDPVSRLARKSLLDQADDVQAERWTNAPLQPKTKPIDLRENEGGNTHDRL